MSRPESSSRPFTDSRWSDTETGPGVFETALAYTDAARMADNGVLFKLMAKSVGMKYGIMPTFMAKPYGNVRRTEILARNVQLISAVSSPAAPVTSTFRCGPPTARTHLHSRMKRSRREVVRTPSTRMSSTFPRRLSIFWLAS